jgi:hypothetical protein
VLIFELLTGTPPFGLTGDDILEKALNMEVDFSALQDARA